MAHKTTENRRAFLGKTAAVGSTLAMSAIAGCADDDDPTDETDPDDLGEQVQELHYLNNPQDYDPQRHDAINFIGERLEDVGFEVDVEVQEWGTLFSNVVDEQDYDLATWWTFFFAEIGDGLLEHFHSDGGSNYYNYEEDEVDEMIDAQMASADEDERVDLIHDIQQRLMEDVPKMPIAHMEAPNLYNANEITSWESHINGFNAYYNMVNMDVEVDTISAAWPEAFGHMNVFASGGESKFNYQFNVMFDRLIQIDGDYQIDLDLGLATDYERPDAETVIYEIREGHTFHDGEPVRPEDVAFTFNYIVENDIPVYIDQASYIDDAEVLDDGRVQINLSRPLGPVHQFIGMEIPIVPEHVWENVDDPVQAETTEEIMVGSGPLQYDYWDEGSEFGFTAHDDHFVGVDFENRYWRIIPETSTVFQLLEDEELTYEPFGRVARQTEELLNEDNHLEAAQELGPDFWHFSMNTDSIDDVEMRRAMVEALPRDGIVEQFIFGFAQPGFNVVSPAFGDFHTDDVPEYEQSLDAARDRLADAGYGWDDEGLLHHAE